jgi:hypothetical protein
MAAFVIKNRVPSPEEMGRTLGLSSKRVQAVRFIMNSPSAATSKRSNGKPRITAWKSSSKRSNA